jgi:hypothetical protein
MAMLRFSFPIFALTLAACGGPGPGPVEVARFGGVFDPQTGGLEIVMLDADADISDVRQALLQKVPVDQDGVTGNAPLGTVEVRNAVGSGLPVVTTLSGATADASDCGGVGTDQAFAFRLRVFNNTGSNFALSGSTPGTVVRIDTVDDPGVEFCHQNGRSNITRAQGLDRTFLASYDYGSVLTADIGEDLPGITDNVDGVAPIGRRIIATGVTGGEGFSFTGSVFGNF